MRSLVLLTNMFPYGSWEPYLETEIEHLRSFDTVHLCALSVREEARGQRRPVANPAVQVHAIPFRSPAFYALNTVRALGDANLYRELGRLAQGRRLTPRRLVALLVFLSRAHHEAGEIFRRLRGTVEDPLIYSYRFAYQPYVGALLRRRFGAATLVARGHGSDLYEDQVPGTAYLPLREEVMQVTDTVFVISEHGRDYLAQRFPALREKVRLRRLGTTDHGLGPTPARNGRIRIVTCSTMTANKRLDLLVEALRLLPDGSYHWTHFGDGPLRPDLERMAGSLPPDSHDLRGLVGNAELLATYRADPFDVIVNVSTSEGVPVSLMEAASFGIPLIATDVGGNGEVVHDGVNGYLLPANPSAAEVAAALTRLRDLDGEGYAALRRGARRVWAEDYQAESNYRAFDEELSSMVGMAR